MFYGNPTLKERTNTAEESVNLWHQKHYWIYWSSSNMDIWHQSFLKYLQKCFIIFSSSKTVGSNLHINTGVNTWVYLRSATKRETLLLIVKELILKHETIEITEQIVCFAAKSNITAGGYVYSSKTWSKNLMSMKLFHRKIGKWLKPWALLTQMSVSVLHLRRNDAVFCLWWIQ